jgi:tungstate transport system substrate-binding protein
MKKILAMIMSILIILSISGCSKGEKFITLATTTSTVDSGLLDYILPVFQKETGIEVKVLSKGTGEALKLGENGDADVLLVHAKAKEEEFVKAGYGVERFEVMYNDFIIVGPSADPAKVKDNAYNDASKALKLISDAKASFISRGDDSGTNTKELDLWKKASITPKGSWYISAGKGMGAVLQMADEMKAYTLSDRATYLSMKDKLDLQIVTEKSTNLYNQYGVIKVNPAKHKIKDKEAQKFVDWILSDKTQKFIGEFGKDKYGISLFIPNAKK